MCWAVHTGIIAHPLAELAALVAAEPALAGHVTYDGATLGDKAAAYLAAVRAAAAVHDGEWVSDGATSGYYIYPSDTASFWDYAGQKMPLNQMNTMGLLWLAIGEAAGDAQARDRAARLATHLLGNLDVAPSGGYRWNYWAGAFVAPGEDVSHAALNVLFAARAAQSGVVFTDAHLGRFATTFVEQIVVDTATSYDAVGGSGAQNGASYRPQLGRWAMLGRLNPSVHAYVRQLFDGETPPVNGSVLLGMAFLVATDRYLVPYSFYPYDWNDLGDRQQATAYGANILTVPTNPAVAHLARLRYAATRAAAVAQWDGSAYHVVLRLAPTGGAVVTSYVPYHPEHWFDYGGSGALFEFEDAFVSGQGIIVLDPENLTAPTITSTPPTTASVGQSLAYQAAASGDAPLRWSLDGPPGATVSPEAGLVAWTPSVAGAAQLTLAVENDSGHASQSFTVTVTGPPGPDGGTPLPDAGAADGPVEGARDAAADGVPAAADGAADRAADAAAEGMSGDCGCRASPGRAAPGSVALALLLGPSLRGCARRRHRCRQSTASLRRLPASMA